HSESWYLCFKYGYRGKDWKWNGQALVGNGTGRSYDVINVSTSHGEARDVFFDVTEFLGVTVPEILPAHEPLSLNATLPPQVDPLSPEAKLLFAAVPEPLGLAWHRAEDDEALAIVKDAVKAWLAANWLKVLAEKSR